MKKKIRLLLILAFVCGNVLADEYYDQTGKYCVTPFHCTIENAIKNHYPEVDYIYAELNKKEVSENVDKIKVSVTTSFRWYNYTILKENYYAQRYVTQWSIDYIIYIGSQTVAGTEYFDPSSFEAPYGNNYSSRETLIAQEYTFSKDIDISSLPKDEKYIVDVYAELKTSNVYESVHGWNKVLGTIGKENKFHVKTNKAGITNNFIRHSINDWAARSVMNDNKQKTVSSFVSDNVPTINSFEAKVEHNDLNCDADKVKCTASLDFSWYNIACNGYKYADDDYGKASLRFDKFYYDIEVLNGTTSLGYIVKRKAYECKYDNGDALPVFPDEQYIANSRKFSSGTIEESAEIDISLLSAKNIKHDINFRVKVYTENGSLTENVEGFKRSFDGIKSFYRWGDCDNGQYIMRWCNTKWYLLQMQDISYTISGEDFTRKNSPSISDDEINLVRVMSDDMEEGGNDFSEDKPGISLSVDFPFHWYNLLCSGPFYYEKNDEDNVAVAKYVMTKFYYDVDAVFTTEQKPGEEIVVRLGNDIYTASKKEVPDTPKAGYIAEKKNSCDNVSIADVSVSLSQFDLNTKYDVRIRISLKTNDVEETLEGFEKKMGVIDNVNIFDVETDYSFTRVPIPLKIETSLTAADGQNRLYVYNDADAEIPLTLTKDGLKKDVYVGLFASVGSTTTPFPLKDMNEDAVSESYMQSYNSSMLYNAPCSKDNAIKAYNRDRLMFFGDLEGKRCPYFCTQYGDIALNSFFNTNYVNKSLFKPGQQYLSRFARPINLLLHTTSFTNYSNAQFDKDNILKINLDNITGDTYSTTEYHLRDFEFCVSAPVSSVYSSNIKDGDIIYVQAKRFSDKELSPAEIGCEPSFKFAGFGEPQDWNKEYAQNPHDFKDGAVMALRCLRGEGVDNNDVFSNKITLIVVPHVYFDELEKEDEPERYQCANNVTKVDSLVEGDVIHIIAKDMKFSDPNAGMTAGDYGAEIFWEYTTDVKKGVWTRVDDPNGMVAKHILDPKELPWVESYKEDDLWLNSRVLINTGTGGTYKNIYFRQSVALTKFVSAKNLAPYLQKVEDGYCIKVVAPDYYTINAVPIIDKDNHLIEKGGNMFLCYGDEIPDEKKEIIYTLQEGGDVSAESLERLLTDRVEYYVERVSKDGIERFSEPNGIKRDSLQRAHLDIQYHKPQTKAQENGDTIVYRLYINSCRKTIMDSVVIITRPHDVLSIDDIGIKKGDGFITDRYVDDKAVVVRALKGSNPTLFVSNAEPKNYAYKWRIETYITDYDGYNPITVPLDAYSRTELCNFVDTIGYKCEVTLNYKNLFLTEYCTDRLFNHGVGYPKFTSFEDDRVSNEDRVKYARLALGQVNDCRFDKAYLAWELDNEWRDFDASSIDNPWVQLKPFSKYINYDMNSFYIRREGRDKAPSGKGCPSDEIIVIVRYFDEITDNVIDFDGEQEITVQYMDPVPELNGTETEGGYGNPSTYLLEEVTRRYFWETASDLNGPWSVVKNVDGEGHDYMSQPWLKPADKYKNLTEAVLVAEGGVFYIRRNVWSMLGSDESSAIKSVSNAVKVISARKLDREDLVHNRVWSAKTDVSLCPGGSDYIVICEEDDYLSKTTKYKWEINSDDGSSVPFTVSTDNYDYRRKKTRSVVSSLDNAVTVDAVTGDYVVSVYRVDTSTGLRSNAVESAVHMWVLEPDFKFFVSSDGFTKSYSHDEMSYSFASGTLAHLQGNVGVVEDENVLKRVWSLQVQDFVEGKTEKGYLSYNENPYLYLYNGGENRISLHVENYSGCKADMEGVIYVDGSSNGGTKRSGFVEEIEKTEEGFVDIASLNRSVNVYPTIINRGEKVNIVTAEENYEVVVVDEIGKTVMHDMALSGNNSLVVDAPAGVYTLKASDKIVRIIIKN